MTAPPKLPISAFIIACNEADRIGRTIASLKELAAEIIVIDSGSTDGTQAVAASLGARVVQHDWPGYGLQKRFGEEQCAERWLLNLDADEELTPALAQEIRNAFAHGLPKQAGFMMQVRDLLPGETKLAPFAHSNPCLRLYDKTPARFSDSPVHDSVIVHEGEVGRFKHPVLHRSFRSIAHMIEKMNHISNVQAEYLAKKGLAFAHARVLLELPVCFLKAYFIRAYALRGLNGFIYSWLYAYGRFVRVVKYLEKIDER